MTEIHGTRPGPHRCAHNSGIVYQNGGFYACLESITMVVSGVHGGVAECDHQWREKRKWQPGCTHTGGVSRHPAPLTTIAIHSRQVWNHYSDTLPSTAPYCRATDDDGRAGGRTIGNRAAATRPAGRPSVHQPLTGRHLRLRPNSCALPKHSRRDCRQ